MNRNIGYVIQPNAMPSAAQAPYLARIVPTGVANDADIVDDLAEEMPVGAARHAAIWREALVRAIPHLEAGETVDIGYFRLVPHIETAMAYEDSAFDPEVNALVVDVRLIGELADATRGLVPTKLSASAIAALVKVSNVMDVGSEAFGTVVGTEEFEVLGNGITLDGEDEYVKALDAKTGEELAAATVVRVSRGQRAFVKFARALPAGRATIEIGTHGLAADEKTHVFQKPVAVLPEPGPQPLAESKDGTVKIMSVDEIHSDEPFMIGGTNLGFDGEANRGIMGALATVNGVSLDWYCGGEEEGSANQSFSPSAPFPPELPSGTYRAAVTFNLAGHGEDLEPLVVEGVKIVVP